MSSDNPLAAWQANFKNDIQILSQLLLVRTQRSDEEVRKEMQLPFQSISDSLSELEALKTLLENYVSTQTAQLSNIQEFHDRIALQERREAVIRAHIPAELCDSLGLNGDPTPPLSRVGTADTTDDDGKENQTINIVGKHHQEQPVKIKKIFKKKTIGNAQPKARAKAKATTKANGTKKARASTNDDIPVIRAVEQDELDAAPQYVKGRLTVDKISGVVTKLNEIARKKYILLAQPFRELNSSDMGARQDMEEAECPETEGRQFLSDSDIRTFGGYRMDATVKAAINMLRHTGALKEVRGKNRARILIIQ